jgi:hypothetical protein
MVLPRATVLAVAAWAARPTVAAALLAGGGRSLYDRDGFVPPKITVIVASALELGGLRLPSIPRPPGGWGGRPQLLRGQPAPRPPHARSVEKELPCRPTGSGGGGGGGRA